MHKKCSARRRILIYRVRRTSGSLPILLSELRLSTRPRTLFHRIHPQCRTDLLRPDVLSRLPSRNRTSADHINQSGFRFHNSAIFRAGLRGAARHQRSLQRRRIPTSKSRIPTCRDLWWASHRTLSRGSARLASLGRLLLPSISGQFRPIRRASGGVH